MLYVSGLIAACPTLIIPFFGDQHLWGRAVNDHNLGPPPIPIDTLTTKRLVEALGVLQSPEVKLRAEEISQQLKSVRLCPSTSHLQQLSCLQDAFCPVALTSICSEASLVCSRMLLMGDKHKTWAASTGLSMVVNMACLTCGNISTTYMRSESIES